MSKNTPLLKHSARLRVVPFIFFIFIFFSVYSVSNVRAQGSYYEGGSVSAGGAGDRIAPAITFTPASGIQFTGGVVTPELLANYLVALDIFLFRLAIVLAALMVTIGGFQWLIAMGNSSKISNAKDTIREAILGLILALTAYVLFSQIDTNFVQFKPLVVGDVKTEQDICNSLVSQQVCQNPPAGAQCLWRCGVADLTPTQQQLEQGYACCVSAGSQSCSPAFLTEKYHTEPIAQDSPALTQMRNCIESNAQVSALLDGTQIYTYDRDHLICNYTRGNSVCETCSHELNSCHYGRRNSPTIGAEAVDYNAHDTSQAGEQALHDAILLTGCGWSRIDLESNTEGRSTGWHTHIETQGCNL